jgi:hypothetical protein
MKKYRLTIILAALGGLATVCVLPVAISSVRAEVVDKEQAEVLNHISGQLDYLRQKRACVESAKSFEEFRACAPPMTDSSLCAW